VAASNGLDGHNVGPRGLAHVLALGIRARRSSRQPRYRWNIALASGRTLREAG
jgi:hypothetical protein